MLAVCPWWGGGASLYASELAGRQVNAPSSIGRSSNRLGRTAQLGERRLVAALEEAAGDVERDRGVTVDVVAVGDRDLDERGEALVAAAREAILNAAKFGDGSTVDVYAETSDGRTQVFV